MATANAKSEQEVAQFFAKYHDALTTSKKKAMSALTASKGREAIEEARKAKLPLGQILDDAVKEYGTHIAEEYTYIDPFGIVITKPQVIQRLRCGDGIFDDLIRRQHNVRIYNDLAVSTSLVKVKGDLGNEDINGEYLETHTLQRVGKDWQLVASQITEVQRLSALVQKVADCD